MSADFDDRGWAKEPYLNPTPPEHPFITYILMRDHPVADGGPGFAGSFDQNTPNYKQLLAEAKADGGLVVLEVASDNPLGSLYWLKEVE